MCDPIRWAEQPGDLAFIAFTPPKMRTEFEHELVLAAHPLIHFFVPWPAVKMTWYQTYTSEFGSHPLNRNACFATVCSHHYRADFFQGWSKEHTQEQSVEKYQKPSQNDGNLRHILKSSDLRRGRIVLRNYSLG